MSVPKKEKDWKDFLLSSGLPLEYAVRRALAGEHLGEPAEFSYFRTNETGQTAEFSVDLHSLLIEPKEYKYFAEFFIECKYRYDTVRWVFTPDSANQLRYGLGGVFQWIDSDSEWQVNFGSLDSARSPYGLCGKGIELLPDGPNPKSIRQAVDQLRYAFASFAADALMHQVQHLLGRQSPLFAYLPVIVTTAQLWRLNDRFSLEEIRQAKEIKEIAKRHGVLVLSEQPSNELKLHTRRAMTSFLTDEGLLPSDEVDAMVRRLADRPPCLFLVAEYSHLPALLRKLKAFLRRRNLLILRPSPPPILLPGPSGAASEI